MKSISLTLIGYGAIGKAILSRLPAGVEVSTIVVPQAFIVETREHLKAAGHADIDVQAEVPLQAKLILECAGHSALIEHVLPALERGVECAVLSIGALSDVGMAEALEAAASKGSAQCHLLSGAIGGIDAIAAAKLAGLDEVIYTGRKPPAGWRGTPAEKVVNLDTIAGPTVIQDGTAREAASLYPKNANVAATLSLAGLGLDKTRAKLIADPTVTENIHEVLVRGAFGEMTLTMRGKPLADNPKTSALTVFSALRFLHNKASAITL